MPSGGAGEPSGRRCHMRLKLLEFAEWSKDYQRPIFHRLTGREQNFSSCHALNALGCRGTSSTLQQRRSRERVDAPFRAFFHLGALCGLATALSVIRIGMLGTRGVPASYSGFETCVEELGARLAARGHDVTVYCRVPHITYNGGAYRGMRLVKLPTIRSKHLDTITHALLSAVHALSQRYDIALFFNVGCSIVTWIPRLAGQRVVLNVDGLDWKRKKWGRVARSYIRASERWAMRFPHRVVTDSRRVQEYYL